MDMAVKGEVWFRGLYQLSLIHIFCRGAGFHIGGGDELHALGEAAAHDGIVAIEAEGTGFAIEDFLADIGVDCLVEFLRIGGVAVQALEAGAEIIEQARGNDDLLRARDWHDRRAPPGKEAEERGADEEEMHERLAKQLQGCRLFARRDIPDH